MAKRIIGVCEFVRIRLFSAVFPLPIAALTGRYYVGRMRTWASRSSSSRDITKKTACGRSFSLWGNPSGSSRKADKSRVRWGRAQRLMVGAELLLGISAIVLAFWLEPLKRDDGLELVLLFLALAIASDWFAINTDRGLDISGSLLAIVLAIALTGATGGVIVGTLSALADSLRMRRPYPSIVCNVAAYALFPFAGGVALERLTSMFDAEIGSLAFAAALMIAFVVALVVNFLFVSLHLRVFNNRPIGGQIVHVLVPL